MNFWQTVATILAITGFAGLTCAILDVFLDARQEHLKQLKDEEKRG